jgi:flagellar biogenesis protein FliO
MKIGKWLLAAYLALLGFTGTTSHYAIAADVPTSQIPYKQDKTSAESDFSRVALGLTGCLLLLAGAVYVIRRRLGLTLPTGQVKKLRIVETHRLNPRSSLYVIEFAGKYHVLAQGEQGVHCVVSTPIESPAVPEKT